MVLSSFSVAQRLTRLDRDAVVSNLHARSAVDSTQVGVPAAGGCPVGEIPDCNGNCAPADWLGDGICDNGAFLWPEIGGIAIFFNCAAFSCDGGDCLPGQCIVSLLTYSVHYGVGEPDSTGGTQCFILTDQDFPGEPDNIVTFDGVLENLATDIIGTVVSVTESETANPDGTISVSIIASSPPGTDGFPSGVPSPITSQPLTDACWFIGIDDHLDRDPPLTVQSGTLTFTLADGTPILDSVDVTPFFDTVPWNGNFGVSVVGGAGLRINGVKLDIVYAPSTCGNGTCDVGETCTSCPADCGTCPSACPGTGECCVDNGTIGCSDTACCEAVCAVDPFCCGNDAPGVGGWDAQCADEAATLCPGIPSCPIACPGTGDCCAVHPELGCSDSACCSFVCGADPFCCMVNWDEICVEQAAQLCGTCTTGACCWDSACNTPGTDLAPVLCGPTAGCSCFEVEEGGGGCTAFAGDCANPCPNGTQDCLVGQQCYINTGCAGPICISDCVLGGAALASVEGVTGLGSRATRVHAGMASRGPVMHCTDSTDVFCTAFGGVYKGNSTLCTDVDVCVVRCGDGVLDFGEVCDDGGTDACAPCNADCTGAVILNLNEYVSFVGCLLGSGGGLGVACDCFDTDADGDVDMRDFASFQRVFNGSP